MKTRRKLSMASVIKRGKTWCVRYRVVDPLGNVTEKRVSGFASKEVAWENARKLEAASSAGVDVHGDRISCGMVMERWFNEHAVPVVQKTTASRYGTSIAVLEKLPIYNEPIRNLSPTRFSHLMVPLQERDPGRLTPPLTAYGYLDPLRLSLSWACAQGIIPRNPIQGYKRS
jgi:hypothetical protein